MIIQRHYRRSLAFLGVVHDAEPVLVDEQVAVLERPALRQEFADGGLVGRERELARLPHRRRAASTRLGGWSERERRGRGREGGVGCSALLGSLVSE